MHNEDDMKRDANEPATKTDLERFATKTDLERFATKTDLELLAIRTDLERFATKTDLERFATKTDLERFATKDDQGRLERIVKNVAVEVSGIKAELTDIRQDFSSALAQTESRLISHMDGFMAKTLKVERDEFWLIHRMDKLEDRVDRIEKKSP